MHIRRDDNVMILAGKEKGRSGRVLEVIPERNRIRVEGLNIQRRHYKPGQNQAAPQGGIIEKAGLIHISNAKLICPSCGENVKATWKRLETGKRVRFCKSCSAQIDKA